MSKAIPELHRSVFARAPDRLTVLRLHFLGANAGTTISGHDKFRGKVNYFRGNDRSRWHSNVPTFSGITYHQLYSGVDLIYGNDEQHLEGTYLVSAEADPARISWRYEGRTILRSMRPAICKSVWLEADAG